MRVLLTGASGFVGSHVLDLLVARDDSVRVLALPETLDQVRHYDNVSLFPGSLADRDLITKAVRGVQVVYHLAGLRPGPPPSEINSVNVRGTENILRACVIGRTGRLVFSSSTSVYDESSWPFGGPITEDTPRRTNSNGPLGHYAQSKIEAENLIRRFQRRHGLEYVILRAPLVYGSARFDKLVLMELIDRPWLALTPRAQFAHMQWVHVRDMAKATVLAGTRPKAANNTFNVAGGELFSLRDLSTLVWSTMSNGQRARFFKYRPPLPVNRTLKYDLSRARNTLEYTPQVSLAEGLDELLHKIGLRSDSEGWRS